MKLDEKALKNLANKWFEILDVNPSKHWPKKYRYTVNPEIGKLRILSVEERNFYEKNGYLIVKNLITKNLLNLFETCQSEDLINVLQTFINNPTLINYARSFCGKEVKHLASLVIDQDYIKTAFGSLNKHEKSSGQLPISSGTLSKLVQYFYNLNMHPADRCVGILICTHRMVKNKLSICVQPSTHQSGQLEIELTSDDGTKIQQIYEKPIKTLYQINSGYSFENRKIIKLQAGDVIFFHPLLAHSIVFENENNELNSVENQICSLNIFYCCKSISNVKRNLGEFSSKFQLFEPPFLNDQLFINDEKKIIENNNENNNEKNNEKKNVLYVGDSLREFDEQFFHATKRLVQPRSNL